MENEESEDELDSRHIANAVKEGEVDKENCLYILQTIHGDRDEGTYRKLR